MKLKLILVFILLSSFVSAQVCTDGDRRDCGFSEEGECKLGTQICDSGEWGVCFGAVNPVDEFCNDGKDNDCDGQIDENCQCNSGEEKVCGVSDIGICKLGKQKCVDNVWQKCEGVVEPLLADLCNNKLDDDCDGEIDEGCKQVSCFDGIKNNDEEDIDCGGSCAACTNCDDGILNQDEERIDCGGSKCEPCESCFDGIKNQDETDVDCGGICGECQDEEEVIFSCGDGVCDIGEDVNVCPEDCKVEDEKNYTPLIIIIFILLFSGIGVYIYFKLFKNGKKEVKSNNFVKPSFDYGRFKTMQKSSYKDDKIESKLKKSIENAKKELEK